MPQVPSQSEHDALAAESAAMLERIDELASDIHDNVHASLADMATRLAVLEARAHDHSD